MNEGILRGGLLEATILAKGVELFGARCVERGKVDLSS